MSHIIFDFETGGKARKGKVINIAFANFKTDTIQDIQDIIPNVSFVKFNYHDISQQDYQFEKDTMDWWASLPKELQQQTFANPEQGISVPEFLQQFSMYIHQHYKGIHGIWTRGNAFDDTIMRRLSEDNNYPELYPFYKVRDVRTFVDTLNIINGVEEPWIGKIKGFKQEYVAHDPIHDVAKDIQQIQMVYNVLKG